MSETQIEQDAQALLSVLTTDPRKHFGGQELTARTDLEPERINAAVGLLLDQGNLEWVRTMGTAPYTFGYVKVTPRGIYEAQRAEAAKKRGGAARNVTLVDVLRPGQSPRPPAPIGSPYGFHDEDWEVISQRKAEAGKLYVVLGHQFESEYFQTDELRKNVLSMFTEAVDDYKVAPGALPTTIEFCALAAGYGEHLFNEIARDIIGADIAVFETSDHNPNVMIEMGVALTWGVRVLPIKREDRPKPPSDISGQTWADYRESALEFLDLDHHTKLVRMVERAVQKKGRG